MKAKITILSAVGHDDDGHEAELIFGTNKADEIIAGGGPQQIMTGNGHDTVWAGGGPDVVYLGNGKDLLQGQGGPDSAYGENGKDVLAGGPGPDTLAGGNGKDIIYGGIAPDLLTGGRGADVFVYAAANEAPGHGAPGAEHEGGEAGHDDGEGGPQRETITDFKPGLDALDFSSIGSVLSFADGPAAHAIWVEQDGGNAVVHADTDGNLAGEHPEELSIILMGVNAAAMSADDFIL
jgi:Ca2+-binding RTX toxin-like protein